MTMLQAMMQMMNAPIPEPSRQQSLQQQYMQQQNAMMSSQKAPTAADRFHSPRNANFPSRNTNGLDNFASMKNPFFMGNVESKPEAEFAYVDAPCAALPYRYYSKIFRHISHSYIDRLVYQKDYHNEKYLWVATEKVKGFSMSLITDGTHSPWARGPIF